MNIVFMRGTGKAAICDPVTDPSLASRCTPTRLLDVTRSGVDGKIFGLPVIQMCVACTDRRTPSH